MTLLDIPLLEGKKNPRMPKGKGNTKGGRITVHLGDQTLFKVRQLAEKAGVPPEDLVEKAVDGILDLPPEKQTEFAKKASFPII